MPTMTEIFETHPCGEMIAMTRERAAFLDLVSAPGEFEPFVAVWMDGIHEHPAMIVDGMTPESAMLNLANYMRAEVVL